MLKMGVKTSKSKEKRDESLQLSQKAYHFLEGSHLKSYSVPTLAKFHRNAGGNRHLELLENAGSTSASFLRDERHIVFGSICADLNSYALERRLYNQDISDHDNLALFNIQQDKSDVLINQPIRDISLCSTGDYLAVLMYSGYSNLEIWSCDDINQLKCVKILEEKNLISHSTCCAFSPNGKYLIVAVCSDYFTTRSRSHLVVQHVDISLGKYSEGKIIDFADKQNHLLVGLFISLEFSPDSNLLAVSSSTSQLYIVCTKTWKLLSVIRSLWGIFHPQWYHELLFSCNEDGQLILWQVVANEGKVVTKSLNTMEICNELATKVSCMPCITPDGNMFAVGLSNGKVVIIDPHVMTVLWEINPVLVSDDFDLSPTASCLCFSKSCQYLLVGYTGEMVAVWILPQTYFTLKHFCRTVIISNCAPKMIPKLPIPNSLKQYLLYQL